MGLTERSALVDVAFKARIGRLPGIDDRPGRTSRFDMEASGTMAGFATNVGGVLALRLEPSVVGAGKVFRLLGVTFRTALGAGEGGSRDRGRHVHGPGHGRTRDNIDDHQKKTEGADEGGWFGFHGSAHGPPHRDRDRAALFFHVEPD